MNWTQLVEERAINIFLAWYNQQHGTDYQVVHHASGNQVPDFQCRDRIGHALNVEITLAQERNLDSASLRGRSNARSLEKLREHVQQVREGKADPLDDVRALAVDGVAAVVSAIASKCDKSYGRDTALVVCDTNPLAWDWDLVADQIVAQLRGRRNPFDRGVFLIEDSGRVRQLV